MHIHYTFYMNELMTIDHFIIVVYTKPRIYESLNALYINTILNREHCHKYTMHKDLLFSVSSVYVISYPQLVICTTLFPQKHTHTSISTFITLWLHILALFLFEICSFAYSLFIVTS